jgi:hypothetical protein
VVVLERLALTSHRPSFIWRMCPVAQSPSVMCVHRLGLVQVIDSNLHAVCSDVCVVMCIVREFKSACTQNMALSETLF